MGDIVPSKDDSVNGEYKIPGKSKLRVSTSLIHKLVLIVPVEEQTKEETGDLEERQVQMEEERNLPEHACQFQRGGANELEYDSQHHNIQQEAQGRVGDGAGEVRQPNGKQTAVTGGGGGVNQKPRHTQGCLPG